MSAEPVHEDPGGIVLKSPPAAPWILLALGLAGIAYGSYLWMQDRPRYGIGMDDWTIGLLGAVACIAALAARHQRVIVGRDYITKYWGTRVRRRFSNRDIVAIRTSINGISILVFAGGSKIYISPAWQGEAQTLHFFRSILEARSGAMSNADEWLPLVYLTFPPRCVSCRDSDYVLQRIHAGWEISMGHYRLDRSATFYIPACRACKKRRRKALIGYWILASALGAAVIAPGLAYLDSMLVMLQVFLTVVIVMNVGINFLPRWANRRHFGISATKLNSNRTAVRLWFRDHQLEMEVRLLTEAYRTKSLAGAHAYLRR